MINVTVYNDRVDLADELEESFHDQALSAVEDAAELWLAKLREILSRRQGTRRTAAPPNEPPEEDTGKLINSWKIIPPKVRGRMVISGIQTRHPGASRLEFGFTDTRGIRTLPHPYIAPSVRESEPGIEALLKERIG